VTGPVSMLNLAGLVLEQVQIRLAGRLLIDLNVQVEPAKVTTVMGPSGSGKSALLAYISGNLEGAFEATGRIVLNGVDLTNCPAHQRRIGMLFQDDLMFPHLSVEGNLMFALPEHPRRRALRRQMAAAALAEVGLAGYGEADPATLSGGQRARVSLMRVLLSEPRALLLDEPFSKLDAQLREQMRCLVFAKARERGLPVLLVTHDEADAAGAGGPIMRL
jgi:putative thiamine transport system ATP-binding protein